MIVLLTETDKKDHRILSKSLINEKVSGIISKTCDIVRVTYTDQGDVKDVHISTNIRMLIKSSHCIAPTEKELRTILKEVDDYYGEIREAFA